ncbi:hypothetical protein [Candidatus Nitrotoga arctica]|uniref:hypothetical protein n=1 Tax=Candidatus Nitrotoga arctica TaxID=453162 RepID=UPI001EFAEAF8|nr:hypothetical protein [Candidatus Nitrotoga arctica]
MHNLLEQHEIYYHHRGRYRRYQGDHYHQLQDATTNPLLLLKAVTSTHRKY